MAFNVSCSSSPTEAVVGCNERSDGHVAPAPGATQYLVTAAEPRSGTAAKAPTQLPRGLPATHTAVARQHTEA